MTDEITVSELHRRIEKLERGTVSDEAFRIVSKNQNYRLQKLESSLTWAFRFTTATAIMLIINLAAFIFFMYGVNVSG